MTDLNWPQPSSISKGGFANENSQRDWSPPVHIRTDHWYIPQFNKTDIGAFIGAVCTKYFFLLHW